MMGRSGGVCCCCSGHNKNSSCKSRRVLYTFGLICLVVGCLGCLLGLFNTSWVYREGGTTTTADTVDHYGLWTACSPDYFDVCRHVFDAMPNIEGGARGSQVLITLAILFYVSCTIVEIISCCGCKLRQKMRIVFENRVVEYVIAVAAVVGFLGMLIFAGEVKNKATREIGQVDYTGGGLSLALSGHIMVVLGCCLLACGRETKTDGKTTA